MKLNKEIKEKIINDFKTGGFTKKNLSEKYNCTYAQVLNCFRAEKRKEFAKEHKEEIKQYKHKYYQKNKNKLELKQKQYSLEHKEEIKERRRKYYQKNKEKIKAKSKKNYFENLESRKKKKKKYYQEHKKEINENIASRRKQDKCFRILSNIRKRIYTAIKNQKATRSRRTLELLGCSIEECRQHLESQFRDNMSWNNYGIVWHIDHIIPCSSFDFTNEEEQKICFNYKNLQPLLVEENLTKSDKMPDGTLGRYKVKNR